MEPNFTQGGVAGADFRGGQGRDDEIPPMAVMAAIIASLAIAAGVLFCGAIAVIGAWP